MGRYYTIVYHGSFSLLNNGSASVNRIVVLPK